MCSFIDRRYPSNLDDTNEKSDIEQGEYVYIEEKDEDDENESIDENINDNDANGKVDVSSDNSTQVTTVKVIATVTGQGPNATNHNSWDGVVKKWVG